MNRAAIELLERSRRLRQARNRLDASLWRLVKEAADARSTMEMRRLVRLAATVEAKRNVVSAEATITDLLSGSA